MAKKSFVKGEGQCTTHFRWWKIPLKTGIFGDDDDDESLCLSCYLVSILIRRDASSRVVSRPDHIIIIVTSNNNQPNQDCHNAVGDDDNRIVWSQQKILRWNCVVYSLFSLEIFCGYFIFSNDGKSRVHLLSIFESFYIKLFWWEELPLRSHNTRFWLTWSTVVHFDKEDKGGENIPHNCHWRHWRRQCKFFWPV